MLVGLDVIGDSLTEINVTSPTGMREITKQTGFNVAGMMIDALEALGWLNKNDRVYRGGLETKLIS